jgi:hypothetical protein
LELNQDQLDELSGQVFGGVRSEQKTTDDFVKQLVNQDKADVKQSFFVAGQRNPDQFAQFHRLSNKFGVKPEFVAENPEPFIQKDKEQSYDYDKLIKSNPKVLEFLKSPENATLAQDDLENLNTLSAIKDDYSTMGGIRDSFWSGLSRMNASLVRIPAYLYDAAALPQNLIAKAVGSPIRVSSPDWARNNSVTEAYEATAKARSANVEELSGDILNELTQGNFKRAGKIAALQAINSGPQQLGNIAAVMAHPLAGLSMAFSTSAAEKNNENLKAGLDPVDATTNATLHGVYEAAFEQIGTFGVLDKWAKKIALAHGQESAKQVFKEASKALVASITGEANEEFLTQAAQDLTDKFMGIKPDVTYGSILSNSINAGLVGGVSGFGTTGPITITDGVFQIRHQSQRSQDLEFYRQLGDVTQKSKLNERTPEKYTKLVEQMVEGSPVEQVYMPVEGVEQYFQSKNINPVEFMTSVGLIQQYEEAKLTGGNIQVPLATWVEKIGKSEHFRGLESNIKFNQDALTKNEEAAQHSQMKELFHRAEVEAQENLQNPEKVEQQQKIESEIEQVRSRLTEQLNATGKYTAQLVNDQVNLIVGPLRYFSAANNQTPLEYLNNINLQIRNGEQNPVDKNDENLSAEVDSFVGPSYLELLSQPMGIPDRDADGQRMYDSSIVNMLKNRIEDSTAGKRYAKVDDSGEVIGSIGDSSTFPEFFKNKGYKKQEVLKIIEKHEKGESLTERQADIFNDLYDGALDAVNRKEFFQFGGRKSDTALVSKLQQANSLKESGLKMSDIRKQTGWFMGPDNRWRYEISDEKAKVKPVKVGNRIYKLSEILDHEALFSAYPSLKDMKVELGVAKGSKLGGYDRTNKVLRVNVERELPKGKLEAERKEYEQIKESPEYKEFSDKYWGVRSKDLRRAYWFDWIKTDTGKRYLELQMKLDDVKRVTPKELPDAALGTILHEVQHAIQHIEGFASGAASGRSQLAQHKYKNSAGEVEARDVEARQKLSDSERNQKDPDLMTWERPIVNWANVTTELPIESPAQISEVTPAMLDSLRSGEQMTLFQGKVDQFVVRPDMPKQVVVAQLPEEQISFKQAKDALLGGKSEVTAKISNGAVIKITDVVFGESNHHLNRDKSGELFSALSPEEKNASAIIAKNLDTLIPQMVFDKPEFNRKSDKKSGVLDYRRFYGIVKIGDNSFVFKLKTERSKNRKEGETAYIEYALKLKTPNLLSEQAEMGSQYSGRYGATGPSTSGVNLSIDQFAEIINSTRSDKSWFQDEINPRASVVFNKYGVMVNLFKGSDPTSLMHEMAHVYLEMFKKAYVAEEAPAWLKSDAEKVLKYLGVSSFDQVKTEQHELWARSVEKYLYEGKAPNDDLAGSFARLKMWFRKIYTDVKSALGVELNNEVREVMDRVFAGDYLLARAENQYVPLITDSIIRGLSPEKRAKFQKLLDGYRARATETVTERLMKNYTRSRRKWWKAETEKIKEIFKKDLLKKPEFAAMNYIKTGELAGSEKAADERAHKLSRASLKEAYGKVPKWVKKSMIHEEGADVRILSDILGFPDLEAFSNAMANAEDLDAAAKRQADEYMQNTYGEAFNDQSEIKELVENAIHNDARAQILRTELEILASEDLPSLKILIRAIGKRPPADDVVKKRAIKTIASKPIKDVRPFVYQKAEARAAKEAAEFLAKGDLNGAFEAKQRELLNFYLYKEAIRAKQEIAKSVEWSRKVFEGKASDVAEKRDWAMVSLARSLLGDFGVTQRDISSAYEYLDKLSEYDEDSYEALKPLAAKWLMNRKDFKEMTVESFTEFMADIDALWELSKSSRELEINGVKHDIEEISTKLIDRLTVLTTSGYSIGETHKVSAKENGIDMLMSYISTFRRIESWVDLVDHNDSNKLFESFIYKPIRQKVDEFKIARKEIREKYQSLLDGYPKEKQPTKIKAPELNYTFEDKGELIAALLHTGNDSNQYKLLAGRKWGSVDEETGAVDPQRWNSFIDRMHREGVITKADWDLVQGIWKLNESLKPGAQKAHKDMYGHFFDEVTSRKFTTPFGEYEGGYMPAVTDALLVEDQRIRQEQDAILGGGNSFMFPTTGRGFTKSRVQKYAAPLKLDMNAVTSHFDKVLRFSYLEPAVKKAAKINGKKDYREILRRYDPYAGSNLITPWLQRVASQRVEQPSQSMALRRFDGVARFMRSSAALQIMAGSLSNATQQFTGIVVASAKISPRHLATALVNYSTEPFATKSLIMEKSAYMKTRLSEGDQQMSEALEQLFNPSKTQALKTFIRENGMIFSAFAQRYVDTIVWQAAYAESIEQGLSNEEAVARADKEVRLTQGSGAAEDVSLFEEGSPFYRWFVQFYGYFNNQSNLLYTETAKKVRDLGWGNASPKLIPLYLSAFLVPAMVSTLISKGYSGQPFDDEDDGLMDDIGWLTLTSTYRGLLAMVPLFGQPANMMIGQFTKEKYDDRLSMSPIVQQLENVGRSAYSGYKAVKGEDLKGYEIKNMLSSLGFVTGVPLAPIGKPIGYLTDVKDKKIKPSGPIDYTRGLVTGQGDRKNK